MKAISLWQPWASAIAAGSKRIETRSWSTSYRGPLLIHAAKRKNIGELMHLHSCWNWIGAMQPVGWGWGKGHDDDIDHLPFGAIVARCELVDCRPTGSFTQAELDAPRLPQTEHASLYVWTERQMGDFELGRFGWVLDKIEALPEPVPCIGRQALFDVPESILLATVHGRLIKETSDV